MASYLPIITDLQPPLWFLTVWLRVLTASYYSLGWGISIFMIYLVMFWWVPVLCNFHYHAIEVITQSPWKFIKLNWDFPKLLALIFIDNSKRIITTDRCNNECIRPLSWWFPAKGVADVSIVWRIDMLTGDWDNCLHFIYSIASTSGTYRWVSARKT